MKGEEIEDILEHTCSHSFQKWTPKLYATVFSSLRVWAICRGWPPFLAVFVPSIFVPCVNIVSS